MNLDSVDQSEINVTIGGVRCEIRGTVTAEEVYWDITCCSSCIQTLRIPSWFPFGLDIL